MLAKDMMKREIITVPPEATVEEVAHLMVDHEISGFPVVDKEGTLLGIVSELDLMYKKVAIAEPSVWDLCIWSALGSQEIYDYQDSFRKIRAKTAAEIMTSPAISVDAEDPAEKAGQIMFEKRIKRIMVTENGKLAGVISRSAFVKMLIGKHTENTGKE